MTLCGNTVRATMMSLACGAALIGTTTFAHADLQLSFYGTLDVWAGSHETAAASDSTLQLASGGMTTSYIGTSMTYTLSDSLKAIAALESYLRVDTGESTRYNDDEFFARNAYIGFEGNLGQIKAGRNISPYFIALVMTNPLGSSMVFSPIFLHSFAAGSGGPAMGDSGWNNSVIYNSPRKAGFAVSAAYAFGERPGENAENKVGGHVSYRAGKLVLVAGGHDISEGATLSGGGVGERGALNGTDQTAAMFGASYDFGAIRLFGQYQYLDTDIPTGNVEIDTYHVGASVPLGRGSLMASYARSEYEGDLERERDTWSLAYNHQLSRQVGLYVALLRDDMDDVGKGHTAGVGGRFQF